LTTINITLTCCKEQEGFLLLHLLADAAHMNNGAKSTAAVCIFPCVAFYAMQILSLNIMLIQFFMQKLKKKCMWYLDKYGRYMEK
jgi:hypothetical protein